MTTIADIADFLMAREAIQLLDPAALLCVIQRPSPLGEAKDGEIAFCGATARNPQALLEATHASLIIIDRAIVLDQVALAKLGVRAVIPSAQARLDFMRVVERFFTRRSRESFILWL